jgi:hypothetical protein
MIPFPYEFVLITSDGGTNKLIDEVCHTDVNSKIHDAYCSMITSMVEKWLILFYSLTFWSHLSVYAIHLNLLRWKFRSAVVELNANGSPFDYSHNTT